MFPQRFYVFTLSFHLLVKIWQVSSCGKCMQHLETCLLCWSWQSFVSTCDVFNCLFPLNVQNEIQLLSRVFCYSWLVCLLGFWLRTTSLVKVGNLISEWHRFRFPPCLTRKRVEKSEAILALLDTSFQCISSGNHVWLVALRGKLSDVVRWGMIAFCRRKGALQNVNKLKHVDRKQERSLLYPRKTFILWPKTYHW